MTEPPAPLDPIELLRGLPPFDLLGPEGMRRVEQGLEIAYFPRGSVILRRGGEPSRHLYVVRKGAVRLEREGGTAQLIEEGECFGFPSLIGQASPHVDVVAAEDTLAYLIPGPVFERLMEVPEFSRFFLQDLAGRLRESAAAEPLPIGPELATPIRRLVTAPPVAVPPTATAGEAAQTMRAARVSSVLVRDGEEPLGILTDRDLRNRVLAEGLGPETPVREAMSSPVRTLPASASLLEALLFLLEHGVHHAPVEEEGRIVGLVTDTDLVRLQAKSPLHLLGAVRRIADERDLAGYARELAGVVEALFWAGVEAETIGRVVARLNDALLGRLLFLAEAALGPPPTPYTWIVHGSEGRMEQTLLSDQDNALVYRDDTPEAAAWCGALAERVVGGLLAAGVPRCAGGYMATNWHRPLAGWEALFRSWIGTPDPQAMLSAANFFDFRAVHGDLSLDPLEDLLRLAGREKLFLAHLAKAAVGQGSPLGLWRQIREEEGGVDLKKGGLLPIVSLARLYGLEAGSPARSTLDRLEAAARAGSLSREGASTLEEAFRFLQRLRLRGQLQTLRAGGVPGNRVPLEDLSPLERIQLKEVFLALREMQEAVSLRFNTDRLG